VIQFLGELVFLVSKAETQPWVVLKFSLKEEVTQLWVESVFSFLMVVT
jgi:hypothetical protein